MTKQQRRNYLDNNGIKCPFCDSDDIEGTCGVDVDAGVATQDIKCNECEKTWSDVYRLVDVKED